MIYLLFVIISLNFIIIFNFKKISKILNLYDHPDGIRKIHNSPTSNAGGIIIFFNMIIFFLFFHINNDFFLVLEYFKTLKSFYIFFIFSLLFFFTGLIDDIGKLSANLKLIIFVVLIYSLLLLDTTILLTNLNFSFLNYSININKISLPFTILCFLLFINAFNMFDGINLQSGFYSLILLSFLLLKNFSLELLIVITISIFFFLYLNYKNMCFLGNNGSLLLSFILSYFFIKFYNFDQNMIYADEIFLLMMIPGLDLLRLFIYRVLNKKHPFKSDRNHIHHILFEKLDLKKTISIILIVIIIPNILSFIFGFTSVFIFITFIFYIYLSFFLKNHVNSKN